MRSAAAVEGLFIRPSTATVAFDQLPELLDIWLEIVPLTPGLRIWAIPSVTDNATQHVTVITPTLR